MEFSINKRHLKFIKFGSLGFAIVLVIFIFLLNLKNPSSKVTIPEGECLPAFRDGGGPYYLPNAPFREKIVDSDNNGEKLIVEGYILDSTCKSIVPNAVLDIWQASEEGEYEDEFYRGKVVTDSKGYYRFESVIPLGYGEGTAYRPPHIHFKVHVNDKEIVTSQMFFEDVRGKKGFSDEYIIDLKKDGDGWAGNHNIILPDYNIK